MRKQLITLAKSTLELWEIAKTMKTPGLFGDDVDFFDKEPQCVVLAKKLITEYGGE